jgi:predicted DNA-binding protein with PD1-like motif
VKYTSATMGRVFVLRLEDGDVVKDTLEAFARDHGLRSALAFFIGGVAGDSEVVVGPDANREDRVVPLVHALAGTQEAFAVGTIFPDEDDRPTLHMHAASGREGGATVGCVRAGVVTWLVGEIILLEITDVQAHREPDPPTGFKLLTVK